MFHGMIFEKMTNSVHTVTRLWPLCQEAERHLSDALPMRCPGEEAASATALVTTPPAPPARGVAARRFAPPSSADAIDFRVEARWLR